MDTCPRSSGLVGARAPRELLGEVTKLLRAATFREFSKQQRNHDNERNRID